MIYDEKTMEKINRFAKTPLSPEEVYVFTLTLCDNEVDRDFEAFGAAALEEMAALFPGKTGIKDHSGKSDSQTARIFEAYTEKQPGRKTALGEDYLKLTARAYMLRSEKNADLIREIEAGIRKEVSVAVSAGERKCSVCGESFCEHVPGRKYGGALCCTRLCGINDVYEWSFVAVPAQREAGVTKKYTEKEEKKENRKKDDEMRKKLRAYEKMREDAEKDVFAVFLKRYPLGGAEKTLKKLIAEMGDSELLEMKRNFAALGFLSGGESPVLAKQRGGDKKTAENKDYKI